jgi:hypothetical protein
MIWQRSNLIEAAWIASAWQFPDGYTIEDFAADTSGWDFWPVVVEGAIAGAVMANGPELHCCIKPAFFRRWATLGIYRRVMRHKALHGRLVTRVNVDHDAGREFVERFGFTMTGNTGHVLHYEMR